MKLSIIVPVYNIEKYIIRCLESLYRQDIPLNEYEVIIVDDGSTDNSPALINDFMKDKINALILTQENRGLGVTRNTGFWRAKAEYIWFVDGDDYIEKNCFQEIYNIIKRGDLDIMQFNIKNIENCGIKESNFINSKRNQDIVSGKLILREKKIYHAVWSAVFKRVFLEKNNLLFKEKLYYEDNEWSIRAYYFASRVLLNNKYYYYYNNIRLSSITKTVSARHVFDALQISIFMIDFCESIHRNDIARPACRYYAAVMFNISLENLSKMNDTNIEKLFISKLTMQRKRIIKTMLLSRSLKYIIESFLIFVSIPLLIKIYKRIKI
ncbi:glycosyl transferase [Spirochaetia bacterium]|nr:glycosyl transferase [Spirochaetia bacterium]